MTKELKALVKAEKAYAKASKKLGKTSTIMASFEEMEAYNNLVNARLAYNVSGIL